jgi:hypothetical protein
VGGSGRSGISAMKSRLFRYSDRASYKTSEVLALFLLSLFLGMFFFLVCAAVDYGIRMIFGASA